MKDLGQSLKNNLMGVVTLVFAFALLTMNAVVAFSIYNAINKEEVSDKGVKEQDEISFVSLEHELFDKFEENQEGKQSFTEEMGNVEDYWGNFEKQRDVFLE